MKRWAGLLALFLLAAIGAVVIVAHNRPDDYVARHARIRPGMTVRQVVPIMHPDISPGVLHGARGGRAGEDLYYLEWRNQMPAAGSVETVLRVYFDSDDRVTRTTIDGEDRQR